MIIIHSNDEQWNKFWANPDHRAHNDRLSWVSWKYPVEPSQAAAVTRKLWMSSSFSRPQKLGGVHLEPLVFDYTGFFRVATHLDWESKRNLPFLAVLRAYNGQTLRQPGMGTELDVRALREQAPWTEGLDGLSPREMDDFLGKLAANASREFEAGQRSAACVTAAEVRDFMIERFLHDPRVNKKHRELWTGWLQSPLEKELRRFELSKVYKAAFIPNFADLCQNFFRQYQDYLKGIQPGRSSNRFAMSGSQYISTQQMEQFLQEIERADTLAINSAQADKFRLNVQLAIDVYKEEHGSEPPYTVHEGLKRCIEAFVLRQAKDITGIVGLSNVGEEERKRLDGAKARLITQHGYCEHCASKLLVEVSRTRDFLTA
jgi:serine protein kinase